MDNGNNNLTVLKANNNQDRAETKLKESIVITRKLIPHCFSLQQFQ